MQTISDKTNKMVIEQPSQIIFREAQVAYQGARYDCTQFTINSSIGNQFSTSLYIGWNGDMFLETTANGTQNPLLKII